eukprot:2218737-Rhodomonas_salina.1
MMTRINYPSMPGASDQALARQTRRAQPPRAQPSPSFTSPPQHHHHHLAPVAPRFVFQRRAIIHGPDVTT